MPEVNPGILRWARETAGFDPAEATRKLAIRPARGLDALERLTAFERGLEHPTRAMLVNMAKKYRRPLLTFYLAEPPRQGDRGTDFRTLSEARSETDEAVLDALMRRIQARQAMIRALLEDEDEAARLPFVASVSIDDGVPSVLESIRRTLPLTLDDFRAQPSAGDAFAALRQGVEAIGVFVLLMGDLGSFHTTLDLETFRGFALADEVAPFVVINSHDAKAAWSFTLIHELAHVWLGQTGVSGAQAEIEIERFCNSVASEFLLPASDLRANGPTASADLDTFQRDISAFARARNISSSLVAYRTFRAGVIDRPLWKRLSTAFRDEWLRVQERQRERNRETEGGPSFYVVRRHRVGRHLLDVVSRMLDAGALSTTKAARVLGVKAKQVGTLLDSPTSSSRLSA